MEVAQRAAQHARARRRVGLHAPRRREALLVRHPRNQPSPAAPSRAELLLRTRRPGDCARAVALGSPRLQPSPAAPRRKARQPRARHRPQHAAAPSRQQQPLPRGCGAAAREEPLDSRQQRGGALALGRDDAPSVEGAARARLAPPAQQRARRPLPPRAQLSRRRPRPRRSAQRPLPPRPVGLREAAAVRAPLARPARGPPEARGRKVGAAARGGAVAPRDAPKPPDLPPAQRVAQPLAAPRHQRRRREGGRLALGLGARGQLAEAVELLVAAVARAHAARRLRKGERGRARVERESGERVERGRAKGRREEEEER